MTSAIARSHCCLLWSLKLASMTAAEASVLERHAVKRSPSFNFGLGVVAVSRRDVDAIEWRHDVHLQVVLARAARDQRMYIIEA